MINSQVTDRMIEEYVEFIKNELLQLRFGRFTGNVDFKVNLKEGSIGNMNCVLSKCVKLVEN